MGRITILALVFVGVPLLAAFSLIKPMIGPIEYKKTQEEVQNCAAISQALSGTGKVQERVFDACLRGDWE